MRPPRPLAAPPHRLGRSLARARRVAGLSMVEAARRLGVDTSTIWRWEAGHHRPPRDLLAWLVGIYTAAQARRGGRR